MSRDINDLPMKLDNAMAFDTPEQAIKYINNVTNQLKSISSISSKQLCHVLREFLSKLTKDSWFWIYEKRKAGIALILEIQANGIYVPRSIKCLHQFVYGSGIPI